MKDYPEKCSHLFAVANLSLGHIFANRAVETSIDLYPATLSTQIRSFASLVAAKVEAMAFEEVLKQQQCNDLNIGNHKSIKEGTSVQIVCDGLKVISYEPLDIGLVSGRPSAYQLRDFCDKIKCQTEEILYPIIMASDSFKSLVICPYKSPVVCPFDCCATGGQQP